MKVKLEGFNKSVIKSELGIEENGPVHSFFTKECYDHMKYFIPGGINSELNTPVDLQTNKIIYGHPGILYQYHGKLMVDPITGKGAFFNKEYGYWSRPARYGIPKVLTARNLKYKVSGTGPYFDSLMWAADREKIEEKVQEFMNRRTK